MNLIYIIFIIIIAFSLITGLIVTFAENREKKICSEIEEEIEEEEVEEQALSMQNMVVDNQFSIPQVNNNYSIENTPSVVPVVQDNNSFSTENAAPVVPVVQNNDSFSTENAAPVVPVIQDNNSFSIENTPPVVPIIQNNNEVYQTPINNSIESTLKVDSIEKLENTVELKLKNKDQFFDTPQLSPYSVVDDDII